MAGGFQKMVPYKIKSMLARRMRLIVQNVTYRRGPVEASVKSVGQRFQWLGKNAQRNKVTCIMSGRSGS